MSGVGCGREQATAPALHQQQAVVVTGLATEHAHYEAPAPGRPTVVRVRVGNQTANRLFLQRCGAEAATRVERETSGGWVRLPAEECTQVLYPPIAIEPGEQRLVEVMLDAAVVSPGARLQGRVRIVLSITRSTDDSPDSPDLLPLAKRTSQVFTIG